MNDHDIFVLALRGRPCFGQKALGVMAFLVQEELDRDEAAEAGVACQKHHPHAALTDLADELVVLDDTAGLQGHSALGHTVFERFGPRYRVCRRGGYARDGSLCERHLVRGWVARSSGGL